MSDDALAQEVARQMYKDTRMPVRDIATTVGRAERTIYKWAARGKWTRRRARGRLWITSASAAPAGPAPSPEPEPQAHRRALVKRLLDSVEKQLQETEARLDLSAGDGTFSEKDARIFALLARTMQQLTLIERGRAPENDHIDNVAPRNVEELRRELSQRLARFITEDAGALPREPEPAGT